MQICVPDTALLHFLTNDCLNFTRGHPGSSLHLNIADLKKTCRRCGEITRKNENPHNDCESELEKRRRIAEHCSDTCGQRLATTFASLRSLGRASRTTLTTHAAAITNLVCNGLLSHVYSFRFNSPVVSSTSVFSFGSFARHSSTSYSSSIPCSRFTRSRISSARTSASSARAPSPSVTIKFAWIGDTSALPRRDPFMPISSMILPVPILPAGGFLKKQPAEREPCGCVAIRRDFASSIRARIFSGSSGVNRKVAPSNNSPSLKDV